MVHSAIKFISWFRSESPRSAHSRLEFIPPAFNPFVLGLGHAVLPFLLRFRTRPWLPASITQFQTHNVEVLAQMYQQFQAKKIRFLIAFRHAEVDDPLCMAYLMSRVVPRVARERGIALKTPLHSHFIYDRGMPLWAGAWLGWFFSRLGGIPIHRGKTIDWQSLRTARDYFANGRFPFTIAPEGATNGHGGIVSPLEPGVAQMGFWCVEDLQAAERSETVVILPIGLQYRYIRPPWKPLDRLLSQLEAAVGLPVRSLGASANEQQAEQFCQRLFHLAQQLLGLMEQFYTRFYHQSIPAPATELQADSTQHLTERLQILLNTALTVAEQYFGIPGKGSVIERCRRLEEAGWTYIYREDIADLSDLSDLERGLADWVAEEAHLRMQHMRLVESFVAATGQYVQENPTVERFAEMALLMFDMLARIRGDKLPHRPCLGYRCADMTVGEPISVSERWPAYQTNRRAARQAITELTQEVKTALEAMIH